MKKSPFGVTELQYLRGLVVTDILLNNYEKEGNNALIDQKTTMYEFVTGVLKKIDELEG